MYTKPLSIPGKHFLRLALVVLTLALGGTTNDAIASRPTFIFPMKDSYKAQEKLLCASTFFARYRDWAVYQLRGDKMKHCGLSCVVARRCPKWEVETVGWLKEIYDIFGPGNAERADMEANLEGIRFSSMAKTDKDCIRFCAQIY